MTQYVITFDDWSPLAAAAHDYAERGWPVFPMQFTPKPGKPGEYSKLPLTKWLYGGDGSKATTDHDVIEQWRRTFGDKWHGIGVPTGAASGVVVLDLDPRHGGTATALPGEPGATARATTAGGGEHYWYLAEGPLASSASQVAAGVDVRGDGGYIVAPPSVNPHTGGVYAWADDADTPLAPAPAWLAGAAATPSAGGCVPYERRLVRVPPQQYAADALQRCVEELEALAVGVYDWNTTLNDQAFSIARYFPNEYLDVEVARSALLAAAVGKGIPLSDAEATIESGFAGSLRVAHRAVTLVQDAAASAPADLEEREYLRLHATHRARLRFEADLSEARHGNHSRSRRMDGADFFLDLPDKRPILWGDGSEVLWIDGEPLMIVGDDGTGKSTLDHQLLACRLGLRDTLLGYSVAPAEGRVVYLAMDRPEQARRAGARLFPKALGDESFRPMLKDRLAVWRGPLPVDVLRSPEVLADWLFTTFGGDVAEVHADSLKDIHSGLSKDEIGSGINSAIQEVVARGVNWVGLHHQRKANGENKTPDQLSDVYGSRWLVAGHGSVLMLTKSGPEDKDLIEIRQIKEPDDRVRPMLLRHDRVNGRTHVVEEASTAEAALVAAGQAGVTVGGVAAAMFGKPERDVQPAERKKAERALGALVKKDWALKQPAAKGGKGGSTPALYFIVEGSTDAE